MRKIGITGAMGSGKSTVARLFQVLGAPVYDADSAAKRLMTVNQPLREQLVTHFGHETFRADGSLNRSYLADRVFRDANQLALLNSLVHPAVQEDSAQWMEKHGGYAYVIKEAALLLESGSYQQLDCLICVVAPEDIRIARVMARDHVTEEEVRLRMNKQWPQEKKASLSHHVIHNDNRTPLIPQVMALHNQWQAEARGTQY